MGIFDRGNSDGSSLPSDVATIVTKFIDDCKEMLSRQPTGDQNAAASQQYVVIQRCDPNNAEKWNKVGASIMGEPNEMSIAAALYRIRTAKLRMAYYAWGGATQAKGGKIIRTPNFEWNNEDVEDEGASTGVDAAGILKGDPVIVLSTLLARTETQRGREAEANFDRLMKLNEASQRQTAHMVDKLTDYADKVMQKSMAILQRADERLEESHDIRVRAMRVETNAMMAERRANLTLEEAEAAFADAEEALEKGNTTGWMRVLEMVMKSEKGGEGMMKIVDRVLQTIEGKLLGSPLEQLRKLGMTDLVQVVQDLDLTEAQQLKAQKLLMDNLNKKSKE